jgi:hypothetical protein
VSDSERMQRIRAAWWALGENSPEGGDAAELGYLARQIRAARDLAEFRPNDPELHRFATDTERAALDKFRRIRGTS